MNQEQYPGLKTLSYYIGFLEQLLAILSEPLLIACAALAVVDFVTGGKLLTLPAIMYIWAGSLAVAVTACFIVTWRRAIYALTLNRYGAALGLVMLGLALGVVDWSAVDVQSLQQTLGLSFSSALAELNLNIILITHLRSGVAIAMAIVVAMSNHAQVASATAPKRRLVLVDKVLDAIAPVVEGQPQPLQLEGPHDALVNTPARDELAEHAQSLTTGRFASKEQEVARAMQERPGATAEEIAQEVGCNIRTAQKWIQKLQQVQEA